MSCISEMPIKLASVVARCTARRRCDVPTLTNGPEQSETQVKVPWVCPSCGHFMVTVRVDVAAPSHECTAVHRRVVFVPYTSSEQAESIRRRLPVQSRPQW